MQKVNICVIGGGSRLWAVTLMKDLAVARDLGGTLKLYDIDYAAAKSNEDLGQRIFQANAPAAVSGKNKTGNFTVQAIEGVNDALSGADIVIISIEPGRTEYRYTDLEVPKQYGILQTVGDTIGPGGIFRALRAIPVFRNYAKKIMQYCPDAWVINYTNPMTWCTTAMSMEEPKIKVLGCCHEVFGTQKFLAEKTAEWFGVEKPHHKEIKVDVCGVNHFTFAVAASWNGYDLYPNLRKMAIVDKTFRDRTSEARQRMEKEEWFTSDHLVALDFLRNHGNLGAAGDRHLVEFVPWYLADETELHHLGVIRTPYEWRIKEAERKLHKVYTDDELVSQPSEEEGVDIIRALLGLEPLYTNLNLPNKGQIPWLTVGHVVETNAYINKNSIVPATAGIPSSSIKSMISGTAMEQELVLKGIFENREQHVFEAFLMDPLVNLPMAQARELYSTMKKSMDETSRL